MNSDPENKASPSEIQRWSGSAIGRSLAVAYGGLVWTVANARDPNAGICRPS